MEIETLRMVEAVLLDGTLGVNAQIDALSLDTPNGSSTPDARPAHVTIRNEVDDDVTVRERDETQFPLVLIETGQAVPVGSGQVFSGVRDYTVPVRVNYLVKSADVASNKRNSVYSVRAIVKSIDNGLFAPGKRDTAGRRNNFVISNCERLSYAHTNQPHDAGVLAGAVEFTATVRDLHPL